MTVHDHSRWGAADQLGAANLLTVEKRLAALRSVREGRVYDVSHEIGMDAPFMVPNQTPFLMSIWAIVARQIKRRRATGRDQRRRRQCRADRDDRACRHAYRRAGAFLEGRPALQRAVRRRHGHRLGAGTARHRAGAADDHARRAAGRRRDRRRTASEPRPRRHAGRTGARRRRRRRGDRAGRHRADPHRLGPLFRHRQRRATWPASRASTCRPRAG